MGCNIVGTMIGITLIKKNNAKYQLDQPWMSTFITIFCTEWRCIFTDKLKHSLAVYLHVLSYMYLRLHAHWDLLPLGPSPLWDVDANSSEPICRNTMSADYVPGCVDCPLSFVSQSRILVGLGPACSCPSPSYGYYIWSPKFTCIWHCLCFIHFSFVITWPTQNPKPSSMTDQFIGVGLKPSHIHLYNYTVYMPMIDIQHILKSYPNFEGRIPLWMAKAMKWICKALNRYSKLLQQTPRR